MQTMENDFGFNKELLDFYKNDGKKLFKNSDWTFQQDSSHISNKSVRKSLNTQRTMIAKFTKKSSLLFYLG